MLHIDETTVRRLLPMPQAIDLLDQVFDAWRDGRAQNQPRRRLSLPSGAMLHSLAGSTETYFGTKVYSTHPQHGAWFHFLLYDAATARPLALFDANFLGQIRTGAATGLATRRLARQDSKTLAVLGSGFQAQSQLDAVCAVRHIETILVYSRKEDKREAFAQANFGTAVASADEAVQQADIVITATNAKDPLFDAASVRPGTHINAVGANHANRRELPGELLAKADYIVVDSIEQAKLEAGDLLLGLPPEEWTRVHELKEGRQRESPPEITVFKSIGLGLEDVAVAGWVYEQVLLGR